MATDPAVNNIELHQRVNRTNTPQPDKILTEQTNAQTVTQEDGNAYAEGGYGWVIVFSSFWITFNFLGILYSWGVIQSALLDAGLSNARNLSIIGGLEAFFFSSSCIPSSHIIAYLGPRISAILGLTLSGLSLLLSSLSTHNLGGLIFLQGILFGISAGFLFMTVYPLPAQFFLRKRGLAMGLTSAGGGLGGAVWSIVIEKLIAKIGLPWTYRFQGFAMLLLCLPAALALRPGYTPPRPTLAPTGGRERSIFRQSMYIRVLVACLILSWPFFIPAFYIPQYSVSIGLTSAQGALNSAQYNIASGVGRITFGLLADYLVGPLTAWATALLLISLSSFFIWPYATNSAAVMGYSWVCGFGSGAHFSLQGSLVGLIVGSHKMHQGIGWIEMATSVGYLLGPITAGILLDEFGGPNAGAKPYRPAMYLIGATSMVAFAIAVWVKWSYTKQVWVTSSMLFFYLHALLAIPPTLNFFVLSFKPHLLPPAQIPHILRNYSALLLSTALITFTFILKPESDGWMAWALAVYHLAPITRAALRIESGEEIWTREMGGPGVHLGLHLIVFWGLLIRGIAGGTATPAELYGG